VMVGDENENAPGVVSPGIVVTGCEHISDR